MTHGDIQVLLLRYKKMVKKLYFLKKVHISHKKSILYHYNTGKGTVNAGFDPICDWSIRFHYVLTCVKHVNGQQYHTN